jgi:hypothetical protein
VPALTAQVDVEPEQEVFAGVVSEAIRLLVAHMELRAVPLFEEKMAVSLAAETCADSGPVSTDEQLQSNKIHSAYAGDLAHELADFTAIERRLLSTVHYRYLCDRVVTSLVARFTSSMYKCKPLRPAGVEQLLADCAHLEDVLLALQWMQPTDLTADGSFFTTVGDEERRATRSFERLVSREMHRPKALLHLVRVPPGQLVEKFISDFPNGSVVDLQHVMGLQGLPGATQQPLLAAMKRLKRGSE